MKVRFSRINNYGRVRTGYPLSTIEICGHPVDSASAAARIGVTGCVEGVGKAGVEVDEATDLFGMAAADRAQLFASDRVSGEDGLL
jgi:hypothetical protein